MLAQFSIPKLRENMPSHFKVKEYCPLVFRNLRERFGVDDVDYRESLTRSQPVQIDSSGKSGAQFYRSYDKYFILKSLTSEEIERMHAFLKHYHPVSAWIDACLTRDTFFHFCTFKNQLIDYSLSI